MVALMLHKSPKICLACSAGGHLRELQLAIGAIPEKRHQLKLLWQTRNMYF